MTSEVTSKTLGSPPADWIEGPAPFLVVPVEIGTMSDVLRGQVGGHAASHPGTRFPLQCIDVFAGKSLATVVGNRVSGCESASAHDARSAPPARYEPQQGDSCR